MLRLILLGCLGFAFGYLLGNISQAQNPSPQLTPKFHRNQKVAFNVPFAYRFACNGLGTIDDYYISEQVFQYWIVPQLGQSQCEPHIFLIPEPDIVPVGQ